MTIRAEEGVKASPGLTLRDVRYADFAAFFAHQSDPLAASLAGVTPRAWDAFQVHWQKILADPAIFKQTILYNGQTAGNLVCFPQGGQRQVGYWVDRALWGRGVATQALQLFLACLPMRPLWAYTAADNRASMRVLEKCGFARAGAAEDEVIFSLHAHTALDPFFAGDPLARQLFEALTEQILKLGPVPIRVSKTQVAFRRRRAFAWAWRPSLALRRPAAPLVLSLSLPQRDPSPRWKEVVPPAPGRWMHHLELYSLDAVDEEVGGWLQAAWETAG